MLIRTLTLLALTLLGSALTFAQTQPKEGTATVSGRVTLKGEPAGGVFVGLQPQQTAPGGMPSLSDRSQFAKVKTDAEGRFIFSGVNAGQYRIVALAPGFVSADDSPLYSGKLVNLADGETLETVELTLKRGAVITGRITDPAGKPIVEKQVQLTKMDARGNFVRFNFGGVQSLTSDDRGVYRIHSLPAGKYKVSFGYSQQDGLRAEMARLYHVQTFHPDTTDEKQARVIDLNEGSEATDIDIKIAEAKKTYDISGRVVEVANGQPVAGVRLGYGTPSPNGGLSGTVSMMTVSDAQGEFQLQGVLPGKYVVFADSRYASQQSDIYSDQTPVEISDADVSGVEIKAHRGGSLSGVAVVEGTNDPAIVKQLSSINLNFIYRVSGDSASGRSARPEANGSFRFSGLKPGKADIRAFTPPDGLKQIRVEYNGAPVTDGFDIQAGESLSNVRVVFGYGTGLIRGQVKILGGALPEGLNFSVMATMNGSSGSSFFVPVDTRQQFLVKNLPPGEYELKLQAYPQTSQPQLAKLMEFLNKHIQRVTVGNGETPIEITINLNQLEANR